ncbi:MAG: hypothetical protein LBU60_02230 [Clostridiales bacterium]|jgi:hypothetical protein|nr:hypothetical protein [Clostridiales bacterium]
MKIIIKKLLELLLSVVIMMIFLCCIFISSFKQQVTAKIVNNLDESFLSPFSFAIFEYEDVNSLTWYELKIEVDRMHLSVNEEFIDKLHTYFVEVFNIVGLTEVSNSKPKNHLITGRTKSTHQSPLNTTSRLGRSIGFFRLQTEFLLKNPFEIFWQQLNSKTSRQATVFEKIADIMIRGYDPIFSTKSVKLCSMIQEVGVDPLSFKNSVASYYFNSNNRVLSNSARHVIVLKQNFLLWQNELQDSQSAVVKVITPNTMGYNAVALGGGIFVVLTIFFITGQSRKRKKL